MERSRIAIVIPVYNEQETVVGVVNEAKKYGDIILVDDNSTDNTYKLLKNENIKILRNSKNIGYEKSLYIGFKNATKTNYEIIVSIDGDGQHPIKFIPLFIRYLDKGADLVVGNRSKKQRLGEYLFSFFFNIISGIKDPLCGMKAFKTKIYSEKKFPFFTSIGSEILTYCIAKNKKIRQININTEARLGKSRFGKSILNELIITASFLKSIFFLIYWRLF